MLTPMSDPKSEVLDYLIRPENIEAALDLETELPRAIDRLNIKFWDTLKDLFEEKLRSEGVTDWKVTFPNGDPSNNFDSDGFYLKLYPIAARDDEFYCRFCVENYKPLGRGSRNGAELIYGL